MSREWNRLLALFVAVVVSAFFVRGVVADLIGVPIVLVSRDLNAAPQPGSRPSAIESARRGSLVVREATGDLRVLVDAAAPAAPPLTPADVLHPDVSYDGSRIVFAGFSRADGAWRIFEIGADGNGLRQITHSDRVVDLARYGAAAPLFATYDDVDPCYLPDGRICFVSTRYPGVALDGRLRTTNLYVTNADGTGLHRITTERFGADTPAVEPSTGRIVYSRWWRSAQVEADPNGKPPEPIPPGSPGYGDIAPDESTLVLRAIRPEDFPGLNSWFLAGIDPDGTDMSMHSGFRLDRGMTQAYRPSFLAGGNALALFIPQTPFYGFPRGDGLRIFQAGPSLPEALGGPQRFPDPDDPLAAGPVAFFYASAAALEDGRILVTAARFSGGSYGVYVQMPGAVDPVLVHDAPGTAELDAPPLASRPVPPVIADVPTGVMSETAPRDLVEAVAEGGTFTFAAENMFFNAPVDVPMANAPPVGKRLAIEFFMSPQRTSPNAGDPPISIRRMDIPPNGRVETVLPAGVPLFEVLRRPDGAIPLGRDGQIFHVGGFNFGRAGETNRCVGCHAGHSQLAVPADPAWTNVAPGAIVLSSSGSRRGPGNRDAFAPANLVDRRTDGVASEWAAEGPDGSVSLHWSATIRAREVVIYGTRPGAGAFGERNQVIAAATVSASLNGVELLRTVTSGPLSPEGTRVVLTAEPEIDRLTVAIRARDVTGLYEGAPSPGLAEIEVIARAVGEPRLNFMRGDATCDGGLNITDSVFILNHLFLGGPSFCCTAAADVDGDGRVNITDSIFGLNFLFIGGPAPPAPFPCGPGLDDGASCSIDVCFA